MIVVWIAALFVAGGMALGVWALRPATKRAALVHEEFTVSARQLELEKAASERIVNPAVAAIGHAVRRFTPGGVLDATSKTLRVADMDSRWSPEVIVGLQALGFAIGSVLGLNYLRVAGGGTMSLLVVCLLVGVLTFGPNARVRRAADDRRKRIMNELPDVLDQLSVTVEAGMSFDGALLRAGQEGRGLLAHELLRAVHDMQLGLSRGEALQAMVDRTDVADLRSFVSAVRQAEKHGFPLANILRLQSQELREKRRARAEERAMQVPVKITFPLVFCILPALFIMILGPAALQISRNL